MVESLRIKHRSFETLLLVSENAKGCYAFWRVDVYLRLRQVCPEVSFYAITPSFLDESFSAKLTPAKTVHKWVLLAQGHTATLAGNEG